MKFSEIILQKLMNLNILFLKNIFFVEILNSEAMPPLKKNETRIEGTLQCCTAQFLVFLFPAFVFFMKHVITEPVLSHTPISLIGRFISSKCTIENLVEHWQLMNVGIRRFVFFVQKGQSKNSVRSVLFVETLDPRFLPDVPPRSC